MTTFKKFDQSLKVMGLMTAMLMLASCQMISREPSAMIIGSWQTEIGKIPVEVVYTQQTVQISGHTAVNYELAGNLLVVAQPGYQQQTIRFDGRNMMIQTDTITGVERIYRRL